MRTEIRTRAFVGMFGVLGLCAVGLASIGCGSSNNSTGGAGSTGTAGTSSTGTAGTTGTSTGTSGTTGTSTGTAGTSGVCTGVAPASATITDFSDAMADANNAGQFRYGTPSSGGTYSYGGLTVALASGALHVTGTVTAGTYAGAGLYFDNCTNATAYQGVQFKLTGDLGTCDMYKFGTNFPETDAAGVGHGVCPSTATNCYGPGSAYTVATTMVTFASMSGGGAVPTVTADEQTRMTSIGWGLHGPTAGCTVDFTIDDVKFY